MRIGRFRQAIHIATLAGMVRYQLQGQASLTYQSGKKKYASSMPDINTETKKPVRRYVFLFTQSGTKYAERSQYHRNAILLLVAGMCLMEMA
jgi:hypothetical protein